VTDASSAEVDYSQWLGGSKSARIVARIFNRLSRHSRLYPATRQEFPEGLAAFHYAAWRNYQAGTWEWEFDVSAHEESPTTAWHNYLTFLHDSWYQDGLYAWRSTHWREDPAFLESYQAAVAQVGSDYRIAWRTHTALWVARLAARLEGSFVEAGTGRGWMMAAILADPSGPARGRDVFLMDTFEPGEVDPSTGSRRRVTSPVYATGPADIHALKAAHPFVQVVAGDVFDTAAWVARAAEPIAFIHFDLNAAEPELFVYESMRASMRPGTVILLDDYGFIGFEKQREAWDSLASDGNIDILALPTGQGLIVI
jgi:hypothetical protein